MGGVSGCEEVTPRDSSRGWLVWEMLAMSVNSVSWSLNVAAEEETGHVTAVGSESHAL